MIQPWPTIIVSTAPSTAADTAEAVCALQLGTHRYHLSPSDAAALMADLAGVVAPVRLGPAARRRNLDDLIAGDQ